MAHQEACQLYIEQEIKDGLAQGKNPSSIGRELTAMIERLFEAHIPARTIEQRARRIDATNVAHPITTQNNSTIPIKQEFQVVNPAQKPGPGRPPKYPQPPSDAIHWARVAISQLSRIEDDDPKLEQALQRVLSWVNEKLRRTKNEHKDY
jgi:hypothetical protein